MMDHFDKNSWILDKKDVARCVEMLGKSYTIIGPAKTIYGEDVTEITKPEMLVLDYSNTHGSWKKVVFPQTEVLFRWDHKKAEPTPSAEVERPGNKDIVLFGIRPCDVLALNCLDRVFKSDGLCDPYYVAKRDAIKIIALACNDPSPTCFCTSVGCGPDSTEGADAIFYDLSTRYYIDAKTQGGVELVACINTLLQPATVNDAKEKEEITKAARTKMENKFDLQYLSNKMENFEATYWHTLHQKCLGCGVCTFLCPTCHCFDITDESDGSYVKRIRTWDSCMFPSFTQHASGHNPRPTRKERLRQRIMHKFNYSLKSYGCAFCVGCGRCIRQCPVNLDIRWIIKAIQEQS
jgi:sulfhydrogenase subunit beta (sulfur reductase)